MGQDGNAGDSKGIAEPLRAEGFSTTSGENMTTGPDSQTGWHPALRAVSQSLYCSAQNRELRIAVKRPSWQWNA